MKDEGREARKLSPSCSNLIWTVFHFCMPSSLFVQLFPWFSTVFFIYSAQVLYHIPGESHCCRNRIYAINQRPFPECKPQIHALLFPFIFFFSFELPLYLNHCSKYLFINIGNGVKVVLQSEEINKLIKKKVCRSTAEEIWQDSNDCRLNTSLW